MATQGHSQSTFPIRWIVAAIAIVVLLVLVFQNSQTVSFDILFCDVQARLIWMLLSVAALGFLAGLVLPRFRD